MTSRERLNDITVANRFRLLPLSMQVKFTFSGIQVKFVLAYHKPTPNPNLAITVILSINLSLNLTLTQNMHVGP